MENFFKVCDTWGMSEGTLGWFIRQHRRAAKLTQAELGSEILRHGRSVSEWENNRTIPDITSLKRLAHFFSVDIEEFTAYLTDDQIARINLIVDETPPDELSVILDELRDEGHRHPEIAPRLRTWLDGWRARGGDGDQSR